MTTSRKARAFNMKRLYNREVISLLLQHLAVLVIGFAIYLLDEYQQLPNRTTLLILFIVTLGKAIYFTVANFMNIYVVRVRDKSFDHFLVLTSMNIVLIVLSFALDYYCINSILPGSILGLLSTNPVEQFFECLYFSVVTFSTTGFGDMTAANLFAKGLVATEITVAFTATIFVIANYANHSNSWSADKNRE